MNTSLNDFLGEIEPAFDEYRIEKKPDSKNEARVYLYFSVDLVNSTLFKTTHQATWVSVFRDFYDIVGAYVIKAFINAKVWKYAGDEILFYIEARNTEDILRAPSTLYSAMIRAQDVFHKEHKHTAHSLYMKGALWIAAVSDSKNANSFYSMPNIYTELSTGLDFVGVDIDEGFRMSKNVSQEKLVLDPKIVFILNKHHAKWQSFTEPNISERVKIVGFEFLKGVWDGRAYPVIWYCNKWDDQDLFSYDEHYNNSFAKEYLNNKENIKKIGYINKIFRDLGFLDQKIEQIEKIVDNERIPINDSGKAEISSELHSATVSFDTANDRALIVKKSNGRDPDARQFIFVQK